MDLSEIVIFFLENMTSDWSYFNTLERKFAQLKNREKHLYSYPSKLIIWASFFFIITLMTPDIVII